MVQRHSALLESELKIVKYSYIVEELSYIYSLSNSFVNHNKEIIRRFSLVYFGLVLLTWYYLWLREKEVRYSCHWFAL